MGWIFLRLEFDTNKILGKYQGVCQHGFYAKWNRWIKVTWEERNNFKNRQNSVHRTRCIKHMFSNDYQRVQYDGAIDKFQECWFEVILSMVMGFICRWKFGSSGKASHWWIKMLYPGCQKVTGNGKFRTVHTKSPKKIYSIFSEKLPPYHRVGRGDNFGILNGNSHFLLQNGNFS